MTYSEISKDLLFALEARALAQSREVNALDKLTSKEKMPKRSGNELKFHYYEEIDTDAIEDLVEGVSPGETELVRATVSGQIKHTGVAIPYTDVLMNQHENAGELVSKMSSELGYSMGRKIEKDGFAIALNGAGTTIPFTNIDDGLKAVAKAMRVTNCPKTTAIKDGSTKNGTSPVNSGWYMFCSVDDGDLFRGATDFLPVEDYGYSDNIFVNEIGAIKSLGLRIIDTANLNDGASVCVGEDSIASLGFESDAKSEIIHQNLGSSGTSDSLKQRGSVGVKSSTQLFVKRADRLVVMETSDSIPFSNAGSNTVGAVDVATTLDGSLSYSTSGVAITYLWAIDTAPAGSAASLVGETTAAPTFTPDLAGEYVMSLVVNDGTNDSAADTMTLTVA